ncbi:ComF family protein [Hymenobacter sp. HMF4947]|uniref:ComF family protein n=1 Tax=Hymenobacter ginkgonis TaxID=2682976 RepID=A0A7K1TD26_9BACT|nr:ComF family protein [Hymenobacter ginkgonis]MVN76306.1 ComF family protein [Hymenobacter ginkgonis]
MLRSLLADFAALFFPRSCLACAEPLVAGEQHLCTACRTELPYTDYHLLPAAQNPLARRFWGKVPVVHTLSYLHFLRHGRVQHLLHQLKYKGQQQVGKALGHLYASELVAAGLQAEFDLVVPVPLHRRKLARRGYNQADAFAEGLVLALPCPHAATALRRTEHTTTQTRKSRTERWQNVATVFEVAEPTTIAGRHVLLVDDVLTTGATLEACAAVLLAAGARAVSIATIACA